MNKKLFKYLSYVVRMIMENKIEVVHINTTSEENFGFPSSDEIYTTVTFRFKEKINE